MKKATQTTPTATFTSFPKNENWVSGTCDLFTFTAKLYDENSSYGINGGRVSKLEIRNFFNEVVYNYDRGLDVNLQKKHTQTFHAIMHLLENSPKRFENS